MRLHELLADIKPGKPAINLSVGEPQHPIPPFVGPVLRPISTISAAIRPTRAPRASAAPPPPGSTGATSCRGRSTPRPRSSCSTAPARACSSARIAAKRYVAATRRQAGDPDSQSVLRRLFGRRRRRRLRAGLSAGHARDRLSARPRRHRRRPAGAHRRLLHRLALQPAGRGRRPRLSRRGWSRWRAASASWCSPTSAIARSISTAARRTACWKPPDPTSPTSSCSTRCRSARTCPDCASASPPATAASSRRYIELRNIAAPQVPVPAQEVAIAAYGDETHVEKNRELYVAKFDLADQIIGNRYGYQRPAGGFFLWLDVSAQGGDEAVDARSSGARAACASSPATISRATAPTAAIPARATSASRWFRTRKPRPRRCIASSPCWARA